VSGSAPEAVFDAVLVGGGPRSTGLVAAIGRLGGAQRVAVVDPLPDGAGSIWRDAQSSLLLANSVAGRIAAPLGAGRDLARWCARSGPPPAHAEEADRIDGSSFPSRRLVGAYLRAGAADVERSLPAGVEVVRIPARVVEVREARDGLLTAVDDRGRVLRGRAVIAATGSGHHEPVAVPPGVGARGVPMSSVPAGAPLHITGLGLTFHDVLSTLTEGRGGRYRAGPDGWDYVPSGREPRVTASSRSGIPRAPKAPTPRRPAGGALDPVALARFRADGGGLQAVVVDEIRRRLRQAGLPDDPLELGDASRLPAGGIPAWVARRATPRDPDLAAGSAGTVIETLELLIASVPAPSWTQVQAVERVAARLTGGPPPQRFRQLDALLRSGTVRIGPPGPASADPAAWSVRAHADPPGPPFRFTASDGAGWPTDAAGRIAVRAGDNRCLRPDGRATRVAVLGDACAFPLVGGLPSPSSLARFEGECDAVVAGVMGEGAPS
jgi:hypothetical protein